MCFFIIFFKSIFPDNTMFFLNFHHISVSVIKNFIELDYNS